MFCLEAQAIEIYNETGRFQQAGKMYAEIGEIYQADGKFSEAVEALEAGAELLVVSPPFLSVFYTQIKLNPPNF